MNLIYKVPHSVLFVHPFAFAGYSRPIFDYNNIWFHMGGTILSILLSLTLSIILWKRRNFNLLLPVILFPWITLWEGIAFLAILLKNGDYYNVSQVTGLPAGMFILIGGLLFLGGSFLFISLFPLLGLAPGNKNALWAVPAGMGLYGLVGLGIAGWVVPGSPFAIRYDLVAEILQTASFRPQLMIACGLIIAGLYVTLYRVVDGKLPAGLRTGTRLLSWQDLLWPAIVSVACVIIGIILIA